MARKVYRLEILMVKFIFARHDHVHKILRNVQNATRTISEFSNITRYTANIKKNMSIKKISNVSISN